MLEFRKSLNIWLIMLFLLFVGVLISEYLIEKNVIKNIDKFNQYQMCYQIKDTYYCK